MKQANAYTSTGCLYAWSRYSLCLIDRLRFLIGAQLELCIYVQKLRNSDCGNFNENASIFR